MRILDYLPSIYQPMLPDFFQRQIPIESLSSCSECVMCGTGKAKVLPEVHYYNEKTKCCTYFPYIPNYLLGSILKEEKDSSKIGKKHLFHCIKRKIGVTPAGIRPGKKYLQFFQKEKKEAFGKDLLLRCPFYSDGMGGCSIWPGRSAVCATWFCRPVSGVEGLHFWRAIREYMEQIEDSLTKYILRESGFDPKLASRTFEKESLTGEEIDDCDSTNAYETMWGEWLGREEEFYLQSYQLLIDMKWKTVEKLLGEEADILSRRADRCLIDMFNPCVPDVLYCKPGLEKISTPEEVVLIGYPGVFSVTPNIWYHLSTMFDGKRTTREINNILSKKHGISFGESFVKRLFHHRILIGDSTGEQEIEDFFLP